MEFFQVRPDPRRGEEETSRSGGEYLQVMAVNEEMMTGEDATKIVKEEDKFQRMIKYNGSRESVVESDYMHLFLHT